jgi:5-formyltetrahydrofolate cyclo-ligase
MRKEYLRQTILQKRNSLSKEEKELKDRAIKEHLFGLNEFQKAKIIFFYFSFGSEAATQKMIRECLSAQKRIFLPAVNRDKKELLWAEVQDFKTLKPGPYGILEPSQNFKELAVEKIELVIVPGIAFDRYGFRLGYGGGYYDRFLCILPPRVAKIGLAYELQIVEEIPCEEQDYPVDKIITEAKIIDCLAERKKAYKINL